MVAKTVYNKDLWEATGQEDVNFEIRESFPWNGHALRKENGKI
jgi:hypothetical protein